jgi:maltose alpha-D-glucosyltransferase/alpha-amylase
VLSYVRVHTDENGYTDTVLCVNNLSRFPQPVELDLRRWEGVRPVELLGGVRFPEIGELPYLLTLGGYGFYWIRLPQTEAQTEAHLAAQKEVQKDAQHETQHEGTSA